MDSAEPFIIILSTGLSRMDRHAAVQLQHREAGQSPANASDANTWSVWELQAYPVCLG